MMVQDPIYPAAHQHKAPMLPTTASCRHYRHYRQLPHAAKLPPNCRQTAAKLSPNRRQTAATAVQTATKLPSAAASCRYLPPLSPTAATATKLLLPHAATNTVRPAARLACTYSAVGPTFPGQKLSMCGTLNTCIYYCFHLVKATATNFYCSIW